MATINPKGVSNWKDGKKHGKGVFSWANGNKYVGEWNVGKIHGQGTYIYSNGNSYTYKSLIKDAENDLLNNNEGLFFADTGDECKYPAPAILK